MFKIVELCDAVISFTAFNTPCFVTSLNLKLPAWPAILISFVKRGQGLFGIRGGSSLKLREGQFCMEGAKKGMHWIDTEGA